MRKLNCWLEDLPSSSIAGHSLRASSDELGASGCGFELAARGSYARSSLLTENVSTLKERGNPAGWDAHRRAIRQRSTVPHPVKLLLRKNQPMLFGESFRVEPALYLRHERKFPANIGAQAVVLYAGLNRVQVM